MNIDAAFPSKWIRAADLQNRDIVLTIVRCSDEEVAGDGSTQPVLWFHGTQKGLALNRTNANTISEALGPETDAWYGQKITLFPTKTDFQGKRVDCIRIRDLVPVPAAAASEPAPAVAAAETPAVTEDDPIPF